MSEILPGLVVLAAGGSIEPPLLLLTILLLGSSRPLPNATALALGYFTTCTAIGVAVLTLFSGEEDAISMVGRVLSAPIGGLLIILGVWRLLRAPDPDGRPPRWTESVGSMSPVRAFVLGIALFPVQIKNLAIFVACVNLIAVARLDLQSDILALALVLVVFAIPVVVVIGLYAAMPRRAATLLASMQVWMVKYDRAITAFLCFVFGVFFLVRGFAGT